MPERERNTEGGSFIGGDVHTAGGDFVGRDKIIYARSSLEELNDYLANAVAFLFVVAMLCLSV